MNVWQTCGNKNHIKKLSCQPWRVVEAQHILTARDLVDSAEEHDILEALLETSKPPKTIHPDYLIFTPFRYPPLKYGSRFGSRFEPSLWYGSIEQETAFAELSYYRLLFLRHTDADLGYVSLQLTAFTSDIKTEKGLDLTELPYLEFREALTSPTDYQITQQLGAEMRAHGVEAFYFYSARSNNNGKNVAAFKPMVFQEKRGQYTKNHQVWQCIANDNQVELVRKELAGTIQRYTFSADQFTIQNQLTAHAEWVAA